MTTLALASKASVVNVVDLVTTDTGGADAYLRWHRALMARLALQSPMTAVEDERRSPVVIEIPRLPGARVVAVFAARSESQPVFVVLAMAANARGLRVLEGCAEVAFLTFDLGVRAEQRKPREPVIEQRLFP